MDDDQKLVSIEQEAEEVQDDQGSNNSAGSASHSSEDFVKVNTDDATLEEADDRVPHRDDVEEVPPAEARSHFANENMASDNYLRDYYEQLPSETADFPIEEEPRDLAGSAQFQQEDMTSVLQPEVVSDHDPFSSLPAGAVGGGLDDGAGVEFGGGHPMFEPVPATSFDPDPPRSISPATPPPLQPVISEPDSHSDDTLEDSDADTPPVTQDSNIVEVDTMSAEQTEFHDDPVSPEGDQEFEQEADPQPVVEAEVQQEEEEKEDTHPEEPLKVEVKEEVRDVPAPVVEDIDTKTEPVSIMSHCPTADEKPKKVAAVQDDDPVVDLIYWRDVKKTAFVFSFLLLVLGSLTCFSVISVVAYVGLGLLIVTVAFRLYRLVLQTLNGTQQPHPFQALLDIDITMSSERVQKYTDTILAQVNCCLTSARDLFLVRNTISSLKLGVFLWLLTYIGCCFNGLTLLIIDVVLAFTVPPVYEKYQTQIDSYCSLVKEKVCALVATAKAKMPGAKQAAKEKAQ